MEVRAGKCLVCEGRCVAVHGEPLLRSSSRWGHAIWMVVGPIEFPDFETLGADTV